MSKQTQPPTATNATKTHQKPALPTVSTVSVAAPERSGLSKIGPRGAELIGPGNGMAGRGATTPLANPKLHRVQRQMAANHFGQQLGNGQMQQVLAFVQKKQRGHKR